MNSIKNTQNRIMKVAVITAIEVELFIGCCDTPLSLGASSQPAAESRLE